MVPVGKDDYRAYSSPRRVGDRVRLQVSFGRPGFCQCFPNYVFYRWVVHDVFKYEKHTDGGFTYSIADDHLIWGPAYGLWNTSVNRGAGSSKPIPQDEPATRFPVWDSPKTIPCSYEPDIPFAPDYKSVPGLISDGIFRRIDIPRSHTNGYV